MSKVTDIQGGYGIDIWVKGLSTWEEEEVTIYSNQIPALLEAIAQWLDCASPKKKQNLTKAKYLLKLAEYVRENNLQECDSPNPGSFSWEIYLMKEERRKKEEQEEKRKRDEVIVWNRLIAGYESKCFDPLGVMETYHIYRKDPFNLEAALGTVYFDKKAPLNNVVTITNHGKKKVYTLEESVKSSSGRIAIELWLIHEDGQRKPVDD